MSQRFRKRTNVIEAIQWTGNNLDEVTEFAKGSARVIYNDNELYILTLDGVEKVFDGDWIVKGAHGEFYPCSSNVFIETYEAVSK